MREAVDDFFDGGGHVAVFVVARARSRGSWWRSRGVAGAKN